MSKPRFLPPETRSKLIDFVSKSFDIIHKGLNPKYRAPFISDSWTDTKLIGQLEILGYWAVEMGSSIPESFKREVQDLKDEVADYVLLEELSAKKKNSSD